MLVSFSLGMNFLTRATSIFFEDFERSEVSKAIFVQQHFELVQDKESYQGKQSCKILPNGTTLMSIPIDGISKLSLDMPFLSEKMQVILWF
jgi:hypothetical protein